jgi:acylpyruvate hydrolase
MRLSTLRVGGGTRAALLEGDTYALLPHGDVGAVLRDEPDWRSLRVGPGAERVSVDAAQLAPPILNPAKIFCLGLNYRKHIEETGREVPKHPTLCAKFARALVGARDDILLPAVSDQADWEVELAVVIGAPARHVDEAAAAKTIAGYTVLNDVSVRDYQYRTMQWLQGKTFESTTPVGPCVVTPDEVGDAADLEVRCQVDGQLMQQGRTSDLLFSPAQVVSYLSRVVTLEPGDIISTGTPEGVGHARKPPLFLSDGQTLTTSIEGIGEMRNRCVKERV